MMRVLVALLVFQEVLSTVWCSRPTKPSEKLLFSKTLPNNVYSTVSITGNRAGNMMPSIGNGFIGTVIFSDTVHVSGLFNGKAYSKGYPIYPINRTHHTHRARLPSTCAINFTVLDVLGGYTAYGLNITEGVFYRWFQAEEGNGSSGSLDIEQRIYAHRQWRNLLVNEITIKNYFERNLTINLTNNFGEFSKDIAFTQYTVDKKTEMEMAYGRISKAEEVDSLKSNVALAFHDIPDQIQIAASDWRTWYFISAAATSVDTLFDPWRQAEGTWKEALRKAWEEIWNSGKIDIEGNLELSQAVYGSMYYILSSIRSDWPYGLSPGGLSGGEEYMGHTFWDQDIWMYPFLVLLYPDLARASLQYRYERLPAARRIARKYGYKGAMFPWESAFTGLETSPGEVYGKNQNHITGDIAHAAKLYWRMTKDTQWLRQNGYQLAKQTAEFWASRVQYRSDVDRYVINHVMPPDEYHYPVNNSVYTNVVAKLNLEFAIKVSEIIGLEAPEEWSKISRLMFIPFDEKNQYHPEYEGYNLNITAKQADTILIGYPLMYNMNTKVRSNDLRLYEERTDPDGPAMTHSMFAIGWLELGKKDRAQKPFTKNFENIVGPFKVWVEHRKPSGQVNFITGAGGFLQTITYGYGGFRIHSDHLAFNPTLPPNSTKMTIRGVNYLGNLLSFEVSTNEVIVSLLAVDEVAPSLEVVSHGKTFLLDKKTKLSLSKGSGLVRMRSKPTISSAASRGLPVGLCVFVMMMFFVLTAILV